MCTRACNLGATHQPYRPTNSVGRRTGQWILARVGTVPAGEQDEALARLLHFQPSGRAHHNDNPLWQNKYYWNTTDKKRPTGFIRWIPPHITALHTERQGGGSTATCEQALATETQGRTCTAACCSCHRASKHHRLHQSTPLQPTPPPPTTCIPVHCIVPVQPVQSASRRGALRTVRVWLLCRCRCHLPIKELPHPSRLCFHPTHSHPPGVAMLCSCVLVPPPTTRH
jgi:hypothetical protein